MYPRLASLTTFLFVLAGPALAEPNVVASIKPVHSLVAAVMDGVGEPALIVDGAASPHAYSMKPSQAARLQEADVVFWVGPALETFLDKSIDTIAASASVVGLMQADGVGLLDVREGGTFEGHDHDDDHDGHDGDGHEHAEDEHAEEPRDPHVWLDPQNAKAMAAAIADALAGADPQNAATYEANAAALAERLDRLTETVAADLRPLANQRFVVFHDGYRYFETRFGLPASGALTVTPDVMPGAQRIAEIRAAIADLGVVCVFSEPQFDPSLAAVATEGMDVRTAILDPLGADLEPGPDLYADLVTNMAASFRTCLSGEG